MVASPRLTARAALPYAHRVPLTPRRLERLA
jgi:hypothetical protein